MGILNVTPDSFSDGGAHDSYDAAVAFAEEMLAAGADIIDVGGESTRPGADAVSAQEELSRVLPVVRALAQRGVVVSIDTYHPDVARACVEAGASIVNDISGFRDPGMVNLAAECDAGVVVMHMLGTPKDMQADPHYDDAVGEISAYLAGQARALEDAGVDRRRICIDPGPGFGKSARHNVEILARTAELARLGYPLMAAFSRKATLGRITGIDAASERIAPSVAAALLAYCGGARVLRVHDVAQTVQALQVASNAAYAYASGASVPGKAPGLATMLPGKRAVVALGSNMGDRQGNIREALRRIDELEGADLMRSSSIYESEPAYYDDQDPFANAVAWVQTEFEPEELLRRILAIEDDMGRVRLIRNGPRCIDLDLLDYEGQVRDTPELTIPHPRILERDFVVTPLLELIEMMRESFGRYLAPEVAGEFRLADGSPVTRERVSYGKVMGKLS